MNYKLIYILIIVASFCNINSKRAEAIVNNDDCVLCKDGSHQKENPYKKGFKNEWPFLTTGAASLALGGLMKSVNTALPYNGSELNQLDRLDVNAFDRPATYNWDLQAQKASDILRTGIIILPIIFLTNHHTRSDFGSLFIMAVEVSTITYGLTMSMKHAVNRTRPLAYNDKVPLYERTSANSRLSYFSGHTSFTAAYSFYFAKVMNDYHPNMKTGYKIGLWSFAAAIPVATGYLRVKGGRHFATDVISGYAFGAAIGWVVPHLHKKNRINKDLSINPIFLEGSRGLHISYHF